MNVVVLLKLVSQANYTDSLCDKPKDRLASGHLVINPADEYALEQILRIRDQSPNTRVTVITMAPAIAESLLYHALAMGADDAIHVCDNCFAGSDTLVTARILAAAISKLPPQDLVICGQRAIDSETGHIAPQLSVYLGIPVVTNVISIHNDDENHVRLARLQDNGLMEIKCSFGAVLSMCCGTEMIRLPSILDLRRARKKTILRLDHKQLDIDENDVGIAGSPTRVIRTTQIRYPNRGDKGTSDLSEGTSVILDMIRKR